MKTDKAPSKNRTLVTKLLFAVVGMFAFGFALVPLYDVICDITGLNGNTNNLAAQAEAGQIIDESREITVQFIARESADIEWGFMPSATQVRVKPGEVNMISYKVTNNTDQVMVGQAIPSVAPNAAAGHLNKVECFCFEEQILQPGESADMPLRFFVDPALPADISKLTLSYTLYNITAKSGKLKELAAR